MVRVRRPPAASSFARGRCIHLLYILVGTMLIGSQILIYHIYRDLPEAENHATDRISRLLRDVEFKLDASRVRKASSKGALRGDRSGGACSDDVEGLRGATGLGNSVSSCEAMRMHCESSALVRRYCPQTCGQCNPRSKEAVPAIAAAKRESLPLLDCRGDPEAEQVLAYWKAPSEKDKSYLSPFASLGRQGEKFVSFEFDNGGWNNIRMAMETSLVLAMAMGRTLVLPPEARLYLLDKDQSWQKHTFDAFFDIEAIKKTYPGRIISFAEFLDRIPADIQQPSRDLQNMLQEHQQHSGPAYDYFREIGVQRMWGADHCAFFYDTPNRQSIEEMPRDKQDELRRFCGKRQPVTYDKEMQESFLVHFPVNIAKGSRLLSHFYAFVYFGDSEMDKWVKRFIRDSLHYKSTIFCQAWRIVSELLKESPQGYNAFHIRRNDFQYPMAWMKIKDIVYIATDEKDHSIFEPFKKHYKVRFLSDYLDKGVLKGVNKNWFGMIEQIVCSRSKRFVGTWWSTFTGYINRMRGYHGDDKKSWYYPKNWKYEMQTYKAPYGETGWWREWPPAWTSID
ncbi:hypothetical protein AAMO2058_000544600 [Amorphochlora amoebiformis]